MRVRSLPTGSLIAIMVAAAIGIAAALWIAVGPNTSTVRFATQRPIAAGASGTQMNYESLYSNRAAGTVSIQAMIGDTPSGGTAFVVDQEGYLLTASHVVHSYDSNRDAQTIFIEFPSHSRVAATIVGIDHFSDVAVLKVDPREATDLQPVPLGDSDRVVVGEPVGVIGAPFGNDGSLTKGIVSGIRTVDSAINAGSTIAGAIQTDASINRGNSGGPIFDAEGDVIAIAQQIKSPSNTSAGVAFGIPINTARRAYQQIRGGGSVKYAYLGITSWTVTPQFARTHNLSKPYGALVQKAASPASDAGLAAGVGDEVFMGETVSLGDQIVSIAHAPVRTADDVVRITARIDPGDAVDIEFWRGNERHTTTLVAAQKQ